MLKYIAAALVMSAGMAAAEDIKIGVSPGEHAEILEQVAPIAAAKGLNLDIRRGEILGIAGIAGSAFTMIGSTGPTAGQQYIVDTFLVVVFGGAQSLLGTLASAFAISQSQSTLEFFLSGSMAKVITLLIVVGILLLRPQGLFANRVRR